jgi:hypothetical protein
MDQDHSRVFDHFVSPSVSLCVRCLQTNRQAVVEAYTERYIQGIYSEVKDVVFEEQESSYSKLSFCASATAWVRLLAPSLP